MTNSGKHTPGPWSISHSPDYFSAGATVVRTGSARTGLVVAVLTNLTAKDANARLIAAAPDLLDALRRMVLHAMGGGSTIEVRDAVVNQARAALAKAEGKDV